MDEKKIETYDPIRGVGTLSGQKPNDVKLGPRRRAPSYYAGETFGRHVVQYKDVERYPNGALPSKRDKHARRISRKALKRRYSKVEKALMLPRAMQAQAREIAREEKKGQRWANRLYAAELRLHQTVYAPDQKMLRKLRTQKRKDKRAGKVDAIGQLVDSMVKKP